jgi:hypothetical protein
MAWASVGGAIDYTTDDGSALFRLRERTVLDVVASQRQAEWSSAAALRHAVLSRGTSWLVPESSAKVAKGESDGMIAAENRAIAAAYPYQADGDGSATVSSSREERMLEIYRQRFGGDPGSPEALETIARMEKEHLPVRADDPELMAATATEHDVSSARQTFSEMMRPRRAAHG